MTELHRPVALDRIGAQGMASLVEAAGGELAAITARLGVVAVERLRCEVKLRRVGAAVIEAQGVLAAQVTEVCVVSLDPFSHAAHEEFTVHFVPAGTEDEDPDPDAVDQIPFAGSAIDLGEAAVEQLALALDAYPRKPGAALPEELQAKPAGPFAALAGLRPQK